MKLRQIAENLLSAQLHTFKSPHPGSTSLYFMRPELQTSDLYNPDNGFDSMATNAGANLYTTGVSNNPRYRKYFGQSRPGTIRL